MEPKELLISLLTDSPDLSVVADPQSWALVKEHSVQHGVAEMIAYIARPHLRGEERIWCDRILSASWNRHLRSIRDVEHSLGLLEGSGVDALVLKGAVLSLRYYAPPFVRKPSMDLDLVVRDADLARACEALSHAGYRPFWPEGESRARCHHVRMIHASLAQIELHFRLSAIPYAIPVEEFFDRAVQYEIPDGRAVRLLSPADEIFHLVLHNAQHRFVSLFHFNELRRIWNVAAPEVRAETIERLISHHFAGVLALTDIAFRASWGEPFLPDRAALPRTWLQWRVNERLYQAFISLSKEYELPMAARRRWADFQLTDRPVDAARFAGDLARLGIYRMGRWFEGREA